MCKDKGEEGKKAKGDKVCSGCLRHGRGSHGSMGEGSKNVRYKTEDSTECGSAPGAGESSHRCPACRWNTGCWLGHRVTLDLFKALFPPVKGTANLSISFVLGSSVH